VHYDKMPAFDASAVNEDLEERMALAQLSCSMILALRRKVNIKVRQPLAKIIIPVLDSHIEEQLEKVKQIVLSEVNVKEAEFIRDTTGLITKKIKPNFKTLGKKYGPRMKEIAAFFATMDQKTISQVEAAGDIALQLPGGEVSLVREDYQITSEDMPGWLVATEGSLTVALDVTVTEELKLEGIARELINRIQNIRKDSGFEVTDRVKVTIASGTGVEKAVEKFRSYICDQTLALEIGFAEHPEGATEVEWEEGTIQIGVLRVK